MVRNRKEPEKPYFIAVAATLEKAITYVFAERLIRNAEARSSTLLCSTIYFQPFTAAGNGGCFGHVARTEVFQYVRRVLERCMMARQPTEIYSVAALSASILR
jgi:hypothetical protein